jgi:glycosyltransferase involved in cell wall biosynthesis
MSEKIKVFIIADHPNAPSGVGTQTKYVIEALLKTGRYKVFCFGGAIKHPDYSPQMVKPYDRDFIIFPIDGYGTPEAVRSALWTEKPDILWFMTDPRFYEWLWNIENEVRDVVPMVYYHVWDNYPAPMFNKKWYESNDVIACISKLTYDIVGEVAPDVERHYMPHAVNSSVFYKKPAEEITKLKEQFFGSDYKRTTFFWNNRNARRKLTGSVLWWFNEFAEEVGPDNVRLIMHTEPKDRNGQDLIQILTDLRADDGRVQLSKEKISPEALAAIYNTVDCTINISDAEGFGLATLESLTCGTPVIANMTGGLQEQVTDGKEFFGIGLEPVSKAVIGSQQVPYIYEDRVSREDFMAALHKMYNMSPEERDSLGDKGVQHVQNNYSFEKFEQKWVELMDSVHENYGSWENRTTRNKAWELMEVI